VTSIVTRPFDLQIVAPSALAEADWQARSTAPGVTYANDFRDPTRVTPFFFANLGDPVLGFISLDTTDGVTGGGCLRIITPTTYSGANSAVFRHPLNSAWTQNSQSFGNTPFWFSWRMKINAGRLVPSTPGAGWKYYNLAQFSVSDGGASGQSNTTAEIVGQDTYQRGFPQAYHQDGNSYPPFEESFSWPGDTTDFKEQNAVDNDPTGSLGLDYPNRFCLYSTSGMSPPFPGCWKWAVEEWMAFKVRVVFGTYGGSAGNQFDMWAAHKDATQWTHTHSFQNFTLGVPQSGYSGSNGLHWHIYETGRVSSTQDATVKWDQIIVSTNDIALPAVGA